MSTTMKKKKRKVRKTRKSLLSPRIMKPTTNEKILSFPRL